MVHAPRTGATSKGILWNLSVSGKRALRPAGKECCRTWVPGEIALWNIGNMCSGPSWRRPELCRRRQLWWQLYPPVLKCLWACRRSVRCNGVCVCVSALSVCVYVGTCVPSPKTQGTQPGKVMLGCSTISFWLLSLFTYLSLEFPLLTYSSLEGLRLSELFLKHWAPILLRDEWKQRLPVARICLWALLTKNELMSGFPRPAFFFFFFLFVGASHMGTVTPNL